MILLLIIIVALVIIWFSSTYNKFQSYIIRINEVDSNIDDTLRKRYDVISRANEIITKLLDASEDILPDIKMLKEEKNISPFELDRRLSNSLTTYRAIIEDNPELKKNNEFTKIDSEIHTTEGEIGAYRRYYNDCITTYNSLAKSFPSNIVALICHIRPKPYYDGKNQYDEILDDFKL